MGEGQMFFPYGRSIKKGKTGARKKGKGKKKREGDAGGGGKRGGVQKETTENPFLHFENSRGLEMERVGRPK